MPENRRTCPECGGRLVEVGETVCRDCGYVVGPEFDLGPEWRAYTPEEREERARGNPLLRSAHDWGMGSEVDWRNRDGKGTDLTPEGKAWARKMRTLQRKARVARGRGTVEGLERLAHAAALLSLPRDVAEEAALLYRKAVPRMREMRIRKKDQLVAACLFSVCRLFFLPRSLGEVAEATGLSRKEVGRAYRGFCRVLSIKPFPLSPSDCFERIASMLGMSGEERRRGLEILGGMDGSVTSGRFPHSLAAAAAYLACNGRVRKAEVSRVAGISEVSLRCRVKELAFKLGVPVGVKG
ncbi:MAG: TFIIB-type zinc ribbon-containing protein [Candidatus Hadarchaeales archaeon]